MSISLQRKGLMGRTGYRHFYTPGHITINYHPNTSIQSRAATQNKETASLVRENKKAFGVKQAWVCMLAQTCSVCETMAK